MTYEDQQEGVQPAGPCWLIATLGPATGLSGKLITFDGSAFAVAGYGPVNPAHILSCERQWDLVWASPDARALVEERANAASSDETEPVAAYQPAVPATALPRMSPRRRWAVALVASALVLIVAVALLPGLVGHRPSVAQQPLSQSPALSQPVSRSSLNWAGYVATGGQFTSVEASWSQPTASASVSRHFSVWVGLDGANNTTCEQVGTVAWTGGGLAFYEMLPRPPVYDPAFHGFSSLELPVHIAIAPGDEITARVNYQGDHRFQLSLLDQTQHLSFSTTQTLMAATCTSAEIIVETHYQGGQGPASFWPIGFTGCKINGRSLSAAHLTLLWTSTPPAARPSPLLRDGSTFLVTHN